MRVPEVPQRPLLLTTFFVSLEERHSLSQLMNAS